MGRTRRKRRRKKTSCIRSVSLCLQVQLVSLRKWLHLRGFSCGLLQTKYFTDTGRGLQVQRAVKPGELIVSLPERCLLTTSTVLDSNLGRLIKMWRPRLSPLLALCVFLVVERERREDSDWFPYINVLPTTYTCPAYFHDDVMAVLPDDLRGRALQQQEAVLELHSSNQDFFRSMQPILKQPVEEVFTYEALRWAWSTVNTRSVFLSRPPSPFLSGQDVYALAPFLDLLNHQPTAQVEAAFSHVTGCYEVRTVAGIQRHQQAFISYGCHDNQRLLLEYGFVAHDNPHSVVYLDTDLLRFLDDKRFHQQMNFLKQNSFSHDLTVSLSGVSWRLMTALRLLATPPSHYPQWKAVLLGQVVSEEREMWCLRAALKLCQRRLEHTHTSLEQISRLLQCSDEPITEQLVVVRTLRQEEHSILVSCVKLLQGMLGQSSDDRPSS